MYPERRPAPLDRFLDTLVEFGKWIFAVCLVLAVAGIAVLVAHVKHHRTPEYALEQIQEVKSETDIKAHEDYLTERGKKIFAIAVWIAKDEKLRPVFGPPIVDSDTMVATFTDPKAEGRLEFKKDGAWQLDNVILTKLKGRTFYTDFSSVAEPLNALAKVMSEKSPGEVMADNRYLTDKGRKVRLRLLEQRKEHPGSDDDFTFDEPVVNGSTAYFTMRGNDGQLEVQFQVVQWYDGWKFDDVVIVKAQGRTINQSFAEQIDSPLWVWFKSAFW